MEAIDGPGDTAVRAVTIVVMLGVLVLGAWSGTYPADDPKGIRYVLWKAGLYKMDTDLAVGIMVGDRHRDDLVIGKTKGQLRQRFGDLLTLEQTSEYNRWGHDLYWKDSDVLFISNRRRCVVDCIARASATGCAQTWPPYKSAAFHVDLQVFRQVLRTIKLYPPDPGTVVN